MEKTVVGMPFPCRVCNAPTVLTCVPCAGEGKGLVPVCAKPECQGKHRTTVGCGQTKTKKRDLSQVWLYAFSVLLLTSFGILFYIDQLEVETANFVCTPDVYVGKVEYGWTIDPRKRVTVAVCRSSEGTFSAKPIWNPSGVGTNP